MNFRDTYSKSVISLYLILLSALAFESAQATVCRLPSFAGFELADEFAREVIGPDTTTTYKDMRIYLGIVGDSLYVYSNYVSNKSEYPSRLVLDGDEAKIGLRGIVLNLVFYDLPDTASLDTLEKAVKSEIQFYVDRWALDHSQYADLDLSEADKISYDVPRGLEDLELGQLKVIEFEKFRELPKDSVDDAQHIPSEVSTVGKAEKGLTPIIKPPIAKPDSLQAVLVSILWGSLWGKNIIVWNFACHCHIYCLGFTSGRQQIQYYCLF